MQLSTLAEFAEPPEACHRLDNPSEPNVASPLPAEGHAWVAGPYSPPDKEGLRIRTVQCMGADGVVVNDTLCIDPNVPEDELWQPTSSTTSRVLTGKIALIRRGDCTFATKGRPSNARCFSGPAEPSRRRRPPQVKSQNSPVPLRPSWSTRVMSRPVCLGLLAWQRTRPSWGSR
jgi:hypothetical protein